MSLLEVDTPALLVDQILYPTPSMVAEATADPAGVCPWLPTQIMISWA